MESGGFVRFYFLFLNSCVSGGVAQWVVQQGFASCYGGLDGGFARVWVLIWVLMEHTALQKQKNKNRCLVCSKII